MEKTDLLRRRQDWILRSSEPIAAFFLASPSDAAEIAEIEGNPAFEGLVGHWPPERHVHEMMRTSSRYFALLSASDQIMEFALVQGFGEPDLKVHLKRIAVREVGSGAGTLLLQEILSWIFTQTNTNRVDLEVFVGNEGAKRAYRNLGFVVEGLLRDYHRRSDGEFASMWLMSMLRRDWTERRCASPPEGSR